MKKKKSIVSQILKENGLEIKGWENVSTSVGVCWQQPVIVDKKTGKRITN